MKEENRLLGEVQKVTRVSKGGERLGEEESQKYTFEDNVKMVPSMCPLYMSYKN